MADVKAIRLLFSLDAIVGDENARHHGKIDIEPWVTTIIEKCSFNFEASSLKTHQGETVVSIAVSGTFPGSPVALDDHFGIEDGEIPPLRIDF